MIIPALIEIILSSTEVTNLISDRLRPGNLEQGEYRAAAEIMVIKDRPEQHLNGGIIMHCAMVAIDCYGDSPLIADQVHRAIENSGLIGFHGTAGTVYVDGVVCRTAYEQDYELPYPASDKRRYVSSMVLEVCWH